MRIVVLIAALLLPVCGPAQGQAPAETLLQDKELNFRLTPPAGYLRMRDAPPEDEVLGEVRAAFQGPNPAQTGAYLVLHRMPTPLPGGFDSFRGRVAVHLAEMFEERFFLDQQVRLTAAGRHGFYLEFVCSGDGIRPQPGGDFRHHVRWYFFPEPGNRVMGVMYSAQESAWRGLESAIHESAASMAALNAPPPRPDEASKNDKG